MTQVRLSTDRIFYTVQGEGPLSGVPSLFVRLDNCNLKCGWAQPDGSMVICDAHYTSWNPSGTAEDMEAFLTELNNAMRKHNCTHVVITGGEPALQPEVVRAIGASVTSVLGHITIETNGTKFVENALLDLICLSPKLKSSTPVGTKWEKVHERNRWKPEAIREWMATYTPHYYFKIVIDRPEDIEEAQAMLDEVDQPLDPEHVLFMPQGIDSVSLWERGRWLAEECKRLGVRFCPRIQIDLYGNRPGT